MTTFDTRSPLQTLSMVSSQRPPRRRSAQNAFDNEDAPPSKRPKIDGVSATGQGKSQVNGHISGTDGRKKKPSYDEEDNGFLFKRTRSKQLQTTNAIESEPSPLPAKSSKPAQDKRRRKTFLSPDISNARTTQQPRRSKRLSGDKAPDPSTPAQLKIKRRDTIVLPRQAEQSSESPQRHNECLPMERTRKGTKIALPFADTPVQNRNKQMREKAASKQKTRRSSSGIRGKRASSLLDSGTSNALPHADVDTNDFYKHIDPTLLEPHRMRHLLTWCSARALPEKVPGGNRDPNEALAVDAARHIQEELLKDFNSKPEMSEWFNREEVGPTVLVKKPNPRNIQNTAKLQELEREIEKLQTEKRTWESTLTSFSAPLNTADTKPAPSKPPTIDPSFLDDPSQIPIFETVREMESLPSSISKRLQRVTLDLEPQIDAFADGIQRISQYRIAAERVADRILNVTAEKLEKRDQTAREASGTAVVGPREVLSALSHVLNQQQGR